MGNQPIEASGQNHEPKPRHAKSYIKQAVALLATAVALVSCGEPATNGSAKVEMKPAVAIQPTNSLPTDEIVVQAEVGALEQQEANIQLLNHTIWNHVVWINAIHTIPFNDVLLEDLHDCEQGNTWYADGYNKNDPSHQRFQGGLGMSTYSWHWAVSEALKHHVVLPPSALQATPFEQKEGAGVLINEGVWGWGCPPYRK